MEVNLAIEQYSVVHDGSLLVGTEAFLLESGVPETAITAAKEAENATKQKQAIRAKISGQIGDTPSLLGTTADAAGVLVAIQLADIVALSASANFSDYKKAKLASLAALAPADDVVSLAQAALQKINDGTVTLTASVKGLPTVIDETLERSTAVAGVLKSAG